MKRRSGIRHPIVFVNSLRVPKPRPAVSEPPQPHTKRGAFGARRPKGGTHAKAPLPSLVASLFLSASWSVLRAGPHRKRTGNAAIGGATSFPPLPGTPAPDSPSASARAVRYRDWSEGRGRRGRDAGGVPASGGDAAGPSSFGDRRGPGGVGRAERAWSRALERAARHVRAL